MNGRSTTICPADASNRGMGGGDALTEKQTLCDAVFRLCDDAVRRGVLIRRPSDKDKEFHFQNWFAGRLEDNHIPFDPPARLTYPDFRLVRIPEGYEVKGLAYPGRKADFDANSQYPSGFHNGRVIFYVFGRYPKKVTGNEFPLIDLVICHGDFLNAHHDYAHENSSFAGFGSYGDIKIRDRKMYIAPSPFALTTGTTGQRTLIVPEGYKADPSFVQVGQLIRVEADHVVVGYSFDMNTNVLTPSFAPNPDAGKEHNFVAYRLTSEGPEVSMVPRHVVDKSISD